MPPLATEHVVRQKMPFDEFLALPEDVHAEYLDGVAIMSPPAEYAQADVGQYWLLDRDRRSLTVIERLDGVASAILELDDGHPTGQVRWASTACWTWTAGRCSARAKCD